MHRVIKQTFIFAIIALAAFAFAACDRAGGSEASKEGDVAATVNGKPILSKDVERIISQQAQGQQAQMSQLQLAQARLQVLDGLIQQEVLFQRAEKEKLLPSEDEINQRINDLKTQSGMTEDQFQKRLKDMNQTNESVREETRKALAIQKLQDKTNSKITISDREVEDFYNSNKQQFVKARGVALADIVVDPADNSAQGIQNDARGDLEAKQKIDLIYQQLKGGADFATVARARSEDPGSVARGGDIGFATEEDLKQNGFPPDLIAKFFGPMQVGSYTEPIKFSNGRWYIFKLQEKRLQNENLTLDSPGVRQQITEALRNQRKEILNAALLEVAMNDAKIVNHLAARLVNSPSDLGLRPASSPAASTASPAPAASPSVPTASSPSPATNASSSPVKVASPKPQASPRP